MTERIFIRALVGLFLCVSLAGGLRAATVAEDQFQQALVKESGERDLEAAVELYKKVVGDPGAERLLIFEARIRMGSCYERLGKIDDAEQVYQQIVKESSSPQSEFAQEAQASLRRLQMSRMVQQGTGTIKPETLVMAVPVFHETPLSISLGPALLASGGKTLGTFAAAARCRLSSKSYALPVYLEFSAVAPVGSSHVMDQSKASTSQTTDAGSLRLKTQASLAVIKELPHGGQRKLIPEVGAGLSITRSELESSSTFSGTSPATMGAGRVTKNQVSPYFVFGLHLYPDRILSMLLQAAYTANPYPQSLSVAPPAHNQTFDVPSSLWAIAAKLQVKVGWRTIVLKRKQ